MASQSTGWFGQVVQRSDDGGATWSPVGNDFRYAGGAGTHLWYDGTPRPFEFTRVWHLEPSASDPDTVLAGVEDAALFRSTDGGDTWQELHGLRRQGASAAWQPGGGGMCLHTLIADPTDPSRMYGAISAAGAFRSDDGGGSWKPINRGLHSVGLPIPTPRSATALHRIAMHPSRPRNVVHAEALGRDAQRRRRESWHEISGDLPSDFGFPIAVARPRSRDGVRGADHQRFAALPSEGRLRFYRSRTGGHEWQPLGAGLPQEHCYVNVLRDAMAVDALEPCGLYFGTTGGQVYTSADEGDSWTAVLRDLPAVLSVEVQTLL